MYSWSRQVQHTKLKFKRYLQKKCSIYLQPSGQGSTLNFGREESESAWDEHQKFINITALFEFLVCRIFSSLMKFQKYFQQL